MILKMSTMSLLLPAYCYLLLFIVVLLLGVNHSSAFITATTTTFKQSLQRQRQNKYILYYLPNNNNNNNEHELELEQDLVYLDIMRRTNSDNSYYSNFHINSSYDEFGKDDVHPLDIACQELMRQEEQNRARAREGGKGGGSFEDDLTSQIKMWKGWDASQGQQGNAHDGFY